jgi:hypothetical protein
MGTQFYLINDQACRTRYRLTAKSELVPTPGYSLTIPQDFHSPRGDFVIEGGGKFWANYRFRSHYVFEGKCEKIN